MSDERTTAQGKSGVACHSCGTAYDVCTRSVLEKYGACCSRCRDFDMHDERPEPATAPRVWEIPDEPEGVDVVWTTDRDTSAPIVWERGMRRWSPAGESRRYTWTEVLERGPVTEGRPPAPEPEYRPGFYRLRGALLWSTPDGSALQDSAISPGALVAVTAVTERDGKPALRVMRADGEHGLALARKFHQAGPERLEHP